MNKREFSLTLFISEYLIYYLMLTLKLYNSRRQLLHNFKETAVKST